MSEYQIKLSDLQSFRNEQNASESVHISSERIMELDLSHHLLQALEYRFSQ